MDMTLRRKEQKKRKRKDEIRIRKTRKNRRWTGTAGLAIQQTP
jgi:hypothetical protein